MAEKRPPEHKRGSTGAVLFFKWKNLTGFGCHRFSTLMIFCLIQVVFAGCNGHESAKKTHFESDHYVPAHWPSDLSDLNAKLRNRLVQKNTPPDDQLFAEIRDLVGWTGEVAADAGLIESDWVSLHEKSELITGRLQESRDLADSELRKELADLCDLIETAAAKISRPFAPLQEDFE